jgi:hypothetical protein
MADEAAGDAAIRAIGDSIALVYDAISAVKKARLQNPSPEEDRKLVRQLAALELQLTHLDEDMTAHIAGTRDWPGPSASQRAAIGDLMKQAEKLTTAALTQEKAVAFATRVLALATDVAAAA